MRTAIYIYGVCGCGDGCCSWSDSTIKFFDHNGKELYGKELNEVGSVFGFAEEFQEWLDQYSKYYDEDDKFKVDAEKCDFTN